jgi:hypothetical protein
MGEPSAVLVLEAALSFPQPHVLGATGANECLAAVGAGAPGSTWTAVGRKI